MCALYANERSERQRSDAMLKAGIVMNKARGEHSASHLRVNSSLVAKTFAFCRRTQPSATSDKTD